MQVCTFHANLMGFGLLFQDMSRWYGNNSGEKSVAPDKRGGTEQFVFSW